VGTRVTVKSLVAPGRTPEERSDECRTTTATWSVVILVDRHPTLGEQVRSLDAQTIPPAHIFVVRCGPDRFPLPSSSPRITLIETNQPIDRLSAFATALNCPTDYICLIDDHPAVFEPRWCEWVVRCDESYEGVYGIEGTRLPAQWIDSTVTGARPLHVDCLHGLWFVRKAHLGALWKETAPLERAEQDVHMAYVFQKYRALNSFVVPRWPGHDCQCTVPSGRIRPEAAVALPQGPQAPGFETLLEREAELKDYDRSLGYLLGRIVKKEPFALIRYGDGEYFIATGQAYRSTREDNWQHENTGGVLGEHLRETFRLHRSNVYYGIHAPCDVTAYFAYFVGRIATRANLTFATVFCNKNFPRFKAFVERHSFDVVVIASALPPTMKIGGLAIVDSHVIDETLVSRWDREYATHLRAVTALARRHERAVFFIAAGPVGKVFIHRMYQANPDNVYCDVGSALDLFTKGSVSRAYGVPGTPDSEHACHF
jgi:hypothetical protein